jgi:DNA-binding response OmpR family regulator
MTGYTDAVGLKELGSLTGAEILQKPFSMTELSARIRAVLDGQQPEA